VASSSKEKLAKVKSKGFLTWCSTFFLRALR
jgi:hypothetical protein